MGVLDKFLDIMRLSDDDDYDNEDFFDDDYDDDYEEKPSKRSFFGKRSKKSDDDYDDESEETYSSKPKAKSAPSNAMGSKVTPMRQPASRRSSANMEVCVIKPVSIDDSREITETLLSGRTVILNLEGLDLEIAQRIIDFTSGAAFAISGNLQKISNYIFLVTPTNVEISGDLQDLLNTSFDASSMKNRY